MATIYDVAERAGVSPATVSKALANRQHVSAATRARVVAAAAELAFIPNPIARHLSNRRTGVVGFLIPYVPDYLFSDPFLLEFIRGMADNLAEQDFHLLLAMPRPSGESGSDPYRRLRQGMVDGAIVLESDGGSGPAAALADQTYPWITLGYRREDDGSSSRNLIHADDYGGALRLTRHLQSLGHTRIGVISGPHRLMGALEERLRGYRAAVAGTGQRLDPTLLTYGDFTPESGYRAVDQLLDLDAPPTAIFALNDRMALGAISRIHERGLRVPADLSVAGFDDVQAAALAVPPLTTVRQPGFDMGLRAATLLGRLIRQELAQFESEVLPTEVIVRASTAAPAPPIRR